MASTRACSRVVLPETCGSEASTMVSLDSPEIAVSAPTRAMADGNLSLGCLASALVKNPSSPGSIPESMAVAVGTGLLAWAMSVAAAVFAR